MASPRKPARRRTSRPADGERYDRSWDTPDHGFVRSAQRGSDGQRAVQLDPEADEELPAAEFYREQIPPHYGG